MRSKGLPMTTGFRSVVVGGVTSENRAEIDRLTQSLVTITNERDLPAVWSYRVELSIQQQRRRFLRHLMITIGIPIALNILAVRDDVGSLAGEAWSLTLFAGVVLWTLFAYRTYQFAKALDQSMPLRMLYAIVLLLFAYFPFGRLLARDLKLAQQGLSLHEMHPNAFVALGGLWFYFLIPAILLIQAHRRIKGEALPPTENPPRSDEASGSPVEPSLERDSQPGTH